MHIAAVTEVELCYLLKSTIFFTDDSVFSHLFCCCRRHAEPKPFMDIKQSASIKSLFLDSAVVAPLRNSVAFSGETDRRVGDQR
jgi:hypothetical protein